MPAVEYGQRFLRFLTGVMRGGDRSEFLDQYVKGKEKAENSPYLEDGMQPSFSEPPFHHRSEDMPSPTAVEMEKSFSN